jgi:hypothetical protein
MSRVHELIASNIDPMLLGHSGNFGGRANQNRIDNSQFRRLDSAAQGGLVARADHDCGRRRYLFGQGNELLVLAVGRAPKGVPGCNGIDLAVLEHVLLSYWWRRARLYRHKSFAEARLRFCGKGTAAPSSPIPKSPPISLSLFSSSAEVFPQASMTCLTA